MTSKGALILIIATISASKYADLNQEFEKNSKLRLPEYIGATRNANINSLIWSQRFSQFTEKPKIDLFNSLEMSQKLWNEFLKEFSSSRRATAQQAHIQDWYQIKIQAAIEKRFQSENFIGVADDVISFHGFEYFNYLMSNGLSHSFFDEFIGNDYKYYVQTFKQKAENVIATLDNDTADQLLKATEELNTVPKKLKELEDGAKKHFIDYEKALKAIRAEVKHLILELLMRSAPGGKEYVYHRLSVSTNDSRIKKSFDQIYALVMRFLGGSYPKSISFSQKIVLDALFRDVASYVYQHFFIKDRDQSLDSFASQIYALLVEIQGKTRESAEFVFNHLKTYTHLAYKMTKVENLNPVLKRKMSNHSFSKYYIYSDEEKIYFLDLFASGSFAGSENPNESLIVNENQVKYIASRFFSVVKIDPAVISLYNNSKRLFASGLLSFDHNPQVLTELYELILDLVSRVNAKFEKVEIVENNFFLTLDKYLDRHSGSRVLSRSNNYFLFKILNLIVLNSEVEKTVTMRELSEYVVNHTAEVLNRESMKTFKNILREVYGKIKGKNDKKILSFEGIIRAFSNRQIETNLFKFDSEVLLSATGNSSLVNLSSGKKALIRI